MSYIARAKTMGRRPVTVVEIDLDYCTRTYGTAPCTAALGVTGATKCYNTKKTCQSSGAYNKTVKTYRFSTVKLPLSMPAADPTVLRVEVAPTVIDPSNGLGDRAHISIQIKDQPKSDYGLDKYIAERTYDSAKTGTFWGKLLARNPYYQNRPLRVLSGYIVDGQVDFSDFQVRSYVIDSISGPDSGDTVTIVAKDVLKLADNERAQVPVANTGALLADIDEVVTSLTLTPTGVGALEYPASGYVCVGREVMAFTRSGDVLTVVRARYNTVAQSHSANDAVQLCKEYITTPVADIVYDLLVNYGDVSASYIDKPSWDAEAIAWLPYHNLSTLITSPTGVKDLLIELSQQALFYIWWDEVTQLIKFQAIRPQSGDDTVDLNEADHILADSAEVEESPDERISQVRIFYAQYDPTDQLDKASNYLKAYGTLDTDAEGAEEYGERRIRTIYSRWLPKDNQAPASVLAARLIARFRDNPRTLTIRLDAKDSLLWTGGYANIITRRVQDFSGAAASLSYQVMSVREIEPGTTYEYKLKDTFFKGRYAYVMSDITPDYSAATDAMKSKGCFVCPDTGVFTDGTPAYKVI